MVDTATFSATDEHLAMIRQSARDFAESRILPNVMEWDESETFPRELFREMGEYGFMGVLVPESYGGTGLGYAEYITIIDEIARVCGSIGLSVAAHNSLCTNHILSFGSESQKRKYLPKLATGEHLGAWGLTEPNTGSDAGRMRTVAVRQPDGSYILNGAKNFITHGISGEVAVVIARTGELLDSHGMTAFIVERGDAGFQAGKKERKLGMRASETAEMIFQDCHLPADRILGQVGEGFIQSMKILDGGRISIAALSLGIARGAFNAALAYSKEREQFGQAISRFQAISFKLADMATEIEASELLTREAGRLKDAHLPVTKISAMAKLYASETAVRVANEAVQIFGGYGFTKDFPAEKYYRDVKLLTIGEGTSEIQKLVISRSLLKD
ncbi:acyl-CoA dehydrogenase family protein [Neolewinella lacunae]|uniref:Cyclohex-1-ene-1-carbonyl-CoA dehydrogenase n=1 Tax=Neolewinella lacunae TaxID=1517758 RepID=A0A923T8I8_9BACT|nr:acyl-CoA dehydrogenase family protein [Neolewinella lacunae]MBC6994601.1 acyl-CoA dehydrogenase family protein [Neolewinella lacunae]MDN3634473.1 acyl-CoA dehydrogenase family protein [Neolewinella lacunae]